MNISKSMPGSLTLLALLISGNVLAGSEPPLPSGNMIGLSTHDAADEPGANAGTRTGGATGSPEQEESSPDALEQAIAQARDGHNPHYVDSSNTRTTFRSFPMQPIDSSDLAQISLLDALTDERLASDDLTLNLDDREFQKALLNNTLPFANNNLTWVCRRQQLLRGC